jgi:hypothetical protein
VTTTLKDGFHDWSKPAIDSALQARIFTTYFDRTLQHGYVTTTEKHFSG